MREKKLESQQKVENEMTSMKLKKIFAALALATVATSASATVLTFDSLTAMVYGDGASLLANMGYDGQNLTYVEAGFQLTLHAPNSAPGAAHISDGTYWEQTYNWHDGIENGLDTFVTLTRVGGGLFNLLGFDYYTNLSSVSADGAAAGFIQDEGSWNTALNGISELRLGSGAFNEIDNISVENASAAVPLPGTLPLLLAGLAVCALARRRRQ
ncbi:PEP-CTERM sorting domain-containing protein [Pseudoduganella sp. LjRoot289]|uniref:PEP-CTERM sorting domain-containing protein n=1 Tax=Pseudoduganella sp. LjRoot289 TaxID=3342314 RepID=UPI003ECD51BD